MSFAGAAVSLAATAISVAFAALVLHQWLDRRKPFQLAWSLGLGLYAVAAFTQFLAEAYGWSEGIYRIYYVVAAPLVAVLGTGSVLLVNRRYGYAFAAYTAILFVAFAWVIAGAPVLQAAFSEPIPGGDGFSESVRIWSPLFTVPGSLALIGVAAYSYWRTRLLFNAWIAIGALVVAAGGALTRFGIAWALYLSELIGIALMFWGFLASGEPSKIRRSAPQELLAR
ncbi:MAG TPA: hypothetical protein VEY12_11145 [Thermoplasmata archaeon]|nr:hypothetical protein [Thermoplasmata archaeon]